MRYRFTTLDLSPGVAVDVIAGNNHHLPFTPQLILAPDAGSNNPVVFGRLGRQRRAVFGEVGHDRHAELSPTRIPAGQSLPLSDLSRLRLKLGHIR
jgi:hypothetical protein